MAHVRLGESKWGSARDLLRQLESSVGKVSVIRQMLENDRGDWRRAAP
jgi:hypothetical protein